MNAKNIIFLDIDGALNHYGTKERTPSGYVGIEPGMVKILARIVEAIDDENYPDYKVCRIDQHLIRTSGMDGLADKYINASIRIIRDQDEHPERFVLPDFRDIRERLDHLAYYGNDHFGC